MLFALLLGVAAPLEFFMTRFAPDEFDLLLLFVANTLVCETVLLWVRGSSSLRTIWQVLINKQMSK